MKILGLSQGQFAIVDDDDFERVSGHKWYATWSESAQTFYARTNIGKRPHRRQMLLHRLILEATESQFVDHRNGNGLDNQRSNIRFCTRAQNQQNTRVGRRNKKCLKGTRQDRGVWIARIRINGKLVQLGRFATELEAAAAYDRAARAAFGEFARPNGVTLQ